MIKELIWKTAPKPLKKLVWFLRKFMFVVIPFAFIIIYAVGFHLFFLNKIYPHVNILDINLGGLTQKEAQEKLTKVNFPQKFILETSGQSFEFLLKDAGINYNIPKTVQKAFALGRKESLMGNTKEIFSLLTKTQTLPFVYSADTNFIDQLVDTINHQLSIPATDPEILVENKTVNITTGKNGQEVDLVSLKKQIFNNLAYAKPDTIRIPINQLTPKITDSQARLIKQKAQNMLGKQLKLEFQDQIFIYKDTDLLTLLQPIQPDLSPNPDKIQQLVSDIAKAVNRYPQDAKLTFEQGQVKEFLPAKDGVEVKEEELSQQIFASMDKLETLNEKEVGLSITVVITKPEVATSEVNNLGIKELIGRGESFYKGSIPSRVHNLSLAASKLNGAIIKPGEEFSFNKTVGEISQLTGYQQAYVIKEGKTILDDGGGVCQVSTTFFRTAINSGLPILERHQHSYRVSYYEQGTKLGLDAAIYQPYVDLRLKNDTSSHILIVTKNDPKTSHLAFEFYGTSDGRQTEIANIRSWDPVPAPPDLYQDDPTLPLGQVKQIEHSIPGVKAAFDYKVTRNGEVLQNRTFYSNYRAWQAVYLRGTAGQ